MSLDFDDLHAEKRYAGLEAYRRSKLANVLFTYELARILAGSGITVNALNPGLVRTNFTNNLNLNPLARSTYGLFMRIQGISAEVGAQTSIFLASSPEVEGETGKYWVRKQVTPSSPQSYDKNSQKRLWEISQKLAARKIGVQVQR